MLIECLVGGGEVRGESNEKSFVHLLSTTLFVNLLCDDIIVPRRCVIDALAVELMG